MRFLLSALIAITLHACGGQVQQTTEAGRAAQMAAVNPQFPDPRPDTAGEAMRRPEPETSPFSKAERDPRRLLDLQQTDLSSILGKPSFIRRDMSAEVWQYRTEACVLDLFLYELDRGFAVTYYEFRSRRDQEVARDECFVNLLRQGISRSARS